VCHKHQHDINYAKKDINFHLTHLSLITHLLKTSLLSVQNQYAFKVRVDSNKKEIKTAVETLFGVTVENVATSVVKGKKKVYKGKIGRRVN
jgi:large subunit ribosomal protein L23